MIKQIYKKETGDKLKKSVIIDPYRIKLRDPTGRQGDDTRKPGKYEELWGLENFILSEVRNLFLTRGTLSSC
jgi:hypothetical protein